MSLELCLTKNFNCYDFENAFLPFLGENAFLPFCRFNLFMKADSERYDKESAFFPFVNRDFPEPTVSINGYDFAPCGDGAAIWKKGEAAVCVYNGFKNIDLCVFDKKAPVSSFNQFLVRAYSYTAIYNGVFIIHSAAINYNGDGILFCGVPGAGKSTQSRLWQKVLGAEPLNNDQPCIVFKDGVPFVHGTPWSGKEPCYKNEMAPVKAIVFIEKAPCERIEKLSIVEAYALIHLNNFVVPVAEGVEKNYDSVVERVAKTVPVYRQFCTKTENAPKELYRVLYESKQPSPAGEAIGR